MITSFRVSISLASLLLFSATPQAALQVQIGQNFTASVFGTDSESLPPDTTGAVGPAHFVELINGRYEVFEKTSGRSVQSMTDIGFWTNAGVSIASTLQVTDPRIIFDAYSQRWFASMVDVNVNARRQRANRFLLAVSKSDNPTHGWLAVAFTVDPVNGSFADFPTLGVDQRGVYLSCDLFTRRGQPAGPLLISIPKDDLLAQPPNIAGRAVSGLLSYGERGDILQPAVTTGKPSSGEIILAVGDIGEDFAAHSKLVASAIEFQDSGGPTLSAPTEITVPPYTIPINPTQPSGSDNLDNGDARISAAVRRVNDVLYAVHAIEVQNRAAIRWYVINATNRTLIQAGTITSTTLDLFYPSIAANEAGTVVIGCNGSSRELFVSCYALVGEMSGGPLIFGEPILLKAGEDNYDLHDSSGSSRWGDYSATTVDPGDPNRFWTIQMYPQSGTVWATQVTELITSPPGLSIFSVGQDVQVSWSVSAGSRLEVSSDLIHWTPVLQSPVITNNRVSLVLPASAEPSFFRLAPKPM